MKEENNFSKEAWQIGFVTGQLKMLSYIRSDISDSIDEIEEEKSTMGIINFLTKMDSKIDLEYTLLDKAVKEISKDVMEHPEKYGISPEELIELKEFANPNVKDTRGGTSFTVIKGGKD